MPEHTIPSLSIRSYTKTMHSHSHEYYQLVLPINGHIEIGLDNFDGKVGVGEGVCIAPNEVHTFRANELCKFVVADLHRVPDGFKDNLQPIFQVNAPFQAFLNFVDIQLNHFTDDARHEVIALFYALLSTSQKGANTDKRIVPVLSHIHQDLTQKHDLKTLADIACMGETQFKVRFKQTTGLSLRNYLVKTKMEKAKALLSNTDTPILTVALSVGYDDVTSFTRRFKAYFGQPPGYYKRS
ncbi:MAG: AraC family transcriptional regulator [Pseudomonadota bacterium]|nr:AraC family transcriptional regulator [Pseudomonadota bacterium]